MALGEARARRYVGHARAANFSWVDGAERTSDQFPATIPLSADSRDVLAYVEQPLAARKPVGYGVNFWSLTSTT